MASRPLSPQQLVLEEEPLAAGPSASVDAVVCVECFDDRGDLERCAECNLPLCRVCASRKGLTFWHYGLECPALVEMGFRAADESDRVIRQTSCLLVLRLLLRGRDSRVETKLCRSSRLSKEELRIANTLKQDFALGRRSEEEVTDALALMQCNAKSLDEAGRGRGAAVYPAFRYRAKLEMNW